MAKQAKRIHKGIRLKPQAQDPSSPQEGQLQVSDGSVRAAGLWEYISGVWQFKGSIGDVQKNYIMNGNMSIAQRGTSFSAVTNNLTLLDRFVYNKGGAVVHTMSQDTDVPTFAQSNYNFSHSLLLTLTTPDTSIAANDYCSIAQNLEGVVYSDLHKREVTLSFWVKATLGGTYCISLRNLNGDRTYVSEYTIAASNTWEHKAVTATLDQIGTWNLGTGIGLRVSWAISAGSNRNGGTANTWVAGQHIATSNQVNGTNTGSTSFRLTGAKLNLGPVNTPFNLFGYSAEGEIDACQRYFQKSYSISTTPGTATTVGSWSMTASTTVLHVPIYFHTKMRAAPTIIQYSPTTGASGQIRDNTGGADVTAATQNTGEGLLVAGANSITDTRLFSGHWTANADL